MPTSDRLNLAKLGNWLMDAEHRQLVVLMNEVDAAISAGKDESTIRSEFDKLVAWAATHFSHEDDSIRHSGYPNAEQHIAQHRDLVKSLSAYAAAEPSHDVDRRLRALDAVQFLEEWLVEHANGEDARLADYLAGKR